MDYAEVLKKIAKLLISQRIPFMIIGGQAVLAYGTARLTQDIDVSLGLAPEKGAELIQILNDNGFTILVENPVDFLNETFVLPVIENQYQVRIDFVFTLSEFELAAIKRVREIEIAGMMIPYASPEDLILMKLIAARPRDIEDVRSILLLNKTLDLVYVRTWANQYDQELDTKVIATLDSILKTI
jgi:predicted nucleotidyltransferase